MPDSEQTAPESPAEPERTGADIEQAVQTGPPDPPAVEESAQETPSTPVVEDAVPEAPPVSSAPVINEAVHEASPGLPAPVIEEAVHETPPPPTAPVVEEAVHETPPPPTAPVVEEAVHEAAPEPAPTEHQPAPTEPEPAATKPEPAPTEPEPAATKPEPAATKPEPAPTKPASNPLDGRIDERGDVIEDEEELCREGMDWFVLRVASNKESSVRETLLRKIQIEKMGHLVGRILVPTEKTKTIKGGRQRITETKLYPGYVFVEMQLEEDGRIPQDVFFLIKETTGVGDFVGTAGRPTPMKPHEIEKMLLDSRKPEEEPEIKLVFARGEHVTIKEGPFQGYEGSVDELLPEKGLVRVLVTIFGRQAPIELEEWQIVRAEDA